MRRIAIIAIIALCMSLAACTGGQRVHDVNSNGDQVESILKSTISKESNSPLEDLYHRERQLVYYTTQLVAGMDHRMVFKIVGMDSEYICLRVWERLNDKPKLTGIVMANTIEEAMKDCGIVATETD